MGVGSSSSKPANNDLPIQYKHIDVDAKEGVIDKLNEELTQCNMKNAELNEQLSKLKEYNTSLDTHIGSLTVDVVHLKKVVAANEKETNVLERTLQTQLDNNNLLSKQTIDLQKELDTLQLKYEVLEENIHIKAIELVDIEATLLESIDVLETKCHKLEIANKEKNNTLSTLQNMLENFTSNEIRETTIKEVLKEHGEWFIADSVEIKCYTKAIEKLQDKARQMLVAHNM